MTQDEIDSYPQLPFESSKDPLTNNHYLLPLFHEKFAPSKLLSTKAKHQELGHFLEFYKHLCSRYELTDLKEKCKGLHGYCTPKMAKMIERLPSYIKGDFKRLIDDLYYFLEGEDESYNLAKVDSFTRKWRKRAVASLENFKRYHRKFLELVGRAIGTGKIDQKEYNRFFWEGIHRSLRKKIEDRLMVIDPNLDVSVPFEMEDVIKAVKAIFNRKRFDQHLLGNKDYGSESETEEENYRPTRLLSDSGSEGQDSGSDDSDAPKKKHTKKKTPTPLPQKPLRKPEPSSPKKTEKDEISKLVDQMSQLKLYLMQKDPDYRDREDPPQATTSRNPMYDRPQYRNPQFNRPPQFNRTPQFNRPPQFNNPPPNRPPPQFVNASYNDQPQREIPPHMTQNPPTRPSLQDLGCFGCGQQGHRTATCTEINTLLNEGIITRNEYGRLCWPDGSYISKDREETLVQAIHRSLKRTNAVRAQVHEINTGKIYDYVGLEREDSDASSEDQEELGWSSGNVADCYAAGAERNPRISRETRKQAQFYPPSGPQRMKILPEPRNAVDARRENPPIHHSSNLHSNQSGFPKRPIPFDVHQNKFEGKTDDEFLPMDVDQGFMKKPRNEVAKVSANQPRTSIPKPPNPRPTTETVSSGIVQEILKKDITVQLGPLLEISPNVRRDLLSAVKGQRAASHQTQDQKENEEKISKSLLGTNFENPSLLPIKIPDLETRDDLLTVSARVGQIKLSAVFDSGSQANIISEKYARLCGLPIQVKNLERIKISGIDGGIAQCVGIIPDATIFLTDSDLETTGELLVVRNSSFTLLLGRPWGTRNGAGIREAPEGTYLSFTSGGEDYEINVSPSQNYQQQLRDLREAVRVQRAGAVRRDVALEETVKGTTPVPDSELGRDPPESSSQSSISSMNPQPNLRRNSEDEDEESIQQAQEQLSEEENDKDEHWSEPPPEPIYNQSTGEEAKERSNEIELELQESYIKMVQRGANDDEWNQFCHAERQRINRDKKTWNNWKKQRHRTPEEPPPESQIPQPNSLEPSQTLATPEPTPPPSSQKIRNKKPPPESLIESEGRTCRVRRESKKAQENQFWQNLKRRAYEREEKLTRKSIRSRNCPAPQAMIASFGRIHGTGESSEEEPTQSRNSKRILVCQKKCQKEDQNDGSAWEEEEDPGGIKASTLHQTKKIKAGIQPGYNKWSHHQDINSLLRSQTQKITLLHACLNTLLTIASNMFGPQALNYFLQPLNKLTTIHSNLNLSPNFLLPQAQFKPVSIPKSTIHNYSNPLPHKIAVV